jgi:UDP-glucose 4-epimerase
LQEGSEVVAVIRPGGEPWRLGGLDVEVLEADVREGLPVAGAPADAVFHLAAHGAYSWQTDDRRILETNLLGTAAVLDAFPDARIVIAGTSSEYGHKAHAPSEGEALEPNSAYAVAKAAASMYGQLRGAVVLRLYSAYGPWEEPDRLVPTLLGHALEGRLPPLVSPRVSRDFVHVDDVCDAFLLALGAPSGAVYNVGSGRQTSIAEIVDVVRGLAGVEAEPEYGSMPDRGWDTDVWVSDPSRIRAELGWEPSVGLEDGLRATLEWLRTEAPTARYAVRA